MHIRDAAMHETISIFQAPREKRENHIKHIRDREETQRFQSSFSSLFSLSLAFSPISTGITTAPSVCRCPAHMEPCLSAVAPPSTATSFPLQTELKLQTLGQVYSGWGCLSSAESFSVCPHDVSPQKPIRSSKVMGQHARREELWGDVFKTALRFLSFGGYYDPLL